MQRPIGCCHLLVLSLESIPIAFVHRRKYVIGHGCIGMLATFEYVALGLICGVPLYFSPSRRNTKLLISQVAWQ